MLNIVNETCIEVHLITIEDPIEYYHMKALSTHHDGHLHMPIPPGPMTV
jgi:Tfp pilus assembly pilus retraction ATPase PilT